MASLVMYTHSHQNFAVILPSLGEPLFWPGGDIPAKTWCLRQSCHIKAVAVMTLDVSLCGWRTGQSSQAPKQGCPTPHAPSGASLLWGLCGTHDPKALRAASHLDGHDPTSLKELLLRPHHQVPTGPASLYTRRYRHPSTQQGSKRPGGSGNCPVRHGP